MDGKAVFRFAVEAMPRCLQTVLDRSQKTLSDLDWVVCHQANSRIIDHCVKSLHAEPSKFYKNISRHGNTSAASIPIALHEMAESDSVATRPDAGLHRLWRRADMGRDAADV